MLSRLRKYFDYYSGRFICSFSNECEECQEFLKKIFREEYRRLEEVQDSNVTFKNSLIHLTCYDKKEQQIVGCIEAIPGYIAKNEEYYSKGWELDQLPEKFVDKALIVDLLGVKPSYRKTITRFKLFEAIYHYSLINKYELLIIMCEPGLLSLYTSLGFRPYSKIRLVRYGYYIPCFGDVNDYELVKKTYPPLYKIAKKLNFPKPSLPKKEVYDYFEHLIKTGFEISSKELIENLNCELTQNLPVKIKYKFLRGSLLMYPELNDVVLTREDGNKYFVIIYKGKFSVEIDNKEIAVLHPGDIFGEISYITGLPRTATVVCKEANGAILIPSLTVFNRITDQKYVAMIWKNIALILAKKIIRSNDRVAGLLIKKDEKV